MQSAPTTPPGLLDQVHAAICIRHLSSATNDIYTNWIRRFILFHGKRHPKEMGVPEVEAFLSHLAIKGKVVPSTLNQAESTPRLPVVLSPTEVARLLDQMSGTMGLFASLRNRDGPS